jgi:hypothetical protein
LGNIKTPLAFLERENPAGTSASKLFNASEILASTSSFEAAEAVLKQNSRAKIDSNFFIN